LPKLSEIYRYVFSYWLYIIFFYFHPLSSSTSTVWKQLLVFRCWHEEIPESKVTIERRYPSTYLQYRCVRPSDLSDVAAGGGVEAQLGGSERK
jgi:hypothetical protein